MLILHVIFCITFVLPDVPKMQTKHEPKTEVRTIRWIYSPTIPTVNRAMLLFQIYFSAVEKWITLEDGFVIPFATNHSSLIEETIHLLLPPTFQVNKRKVLDTKNKDLRWEYCITLNQSIGFCDVAELWSEWFQGWGFVASHCKPLISHSN